MSERSFNQESSSREAAGAGFTYRCVCGQLLEILPESETVCPGCERHYPVGFLGGDDTGEETMVATLCERQTKVVNAPSEVNALVGQKWGHFSIVEPLGIGGMGTVYRALDESLQRYVALKVILGAGNAGEESEGVQQLFQEARAQARVNHPNVVHIYYVDRSHGAPFFAMELVPGSTLKDRLEEGVLPFDEVVRVGLQVADALKHAAKYGIVHGDIKPSNMLLTEAGDVKLSDFGLARHLSEANTREGKLAGTPNYLSPEAAAKGATDFRSDLYSLGVTLFELTFGKLPYSYESKTVEERLEAHQYRPVEFPSDWPESVPRSWEELLRRLLAKNPEDRFESFDELIEALEEARPLNLPSAGILPRGLAWLVDMFCLVGAAVIAYLPVKMDLRIPYLEQYAVLDSVVAILASVGPILLAVGFHGQFGNTPGKILFQLRVVDRHGVSPSRMALVSRLGLQFLSVWTLFVVGMIEAFGIYDFANGMIFLFVFSSLIIEMGFVLFSDSRRSLHDRLFRTRVVIDGGQ